MLLLVLFVAVFNLCLGVALAEFMSRHALLPPLRLPRKKSSPARPVAAAVPTEVLQFAEMHLPAVIAAPVVLSAVTTEDVPVQTPPTAEPVTATESVAETTAVLQVDATPIASVEHDIPAEWLALLASVGPVNSFAEAAIEVLKLQVGEYRDQLVEIDRKARALGPTADGVARAACLGVLREVNQEWQAQQRAAAEQLKSGAGGLGEYSKMGRWLIDVLDQQAAQIESTAHNIDALSPWTDPPRDRQRLLDEIGRLVDQAHLLRDMMQESTVQVLRREDRLVTLEKPRLLDAATGLLNRVGVEAMFDEWWQNDPTRQRHLSVAALDLDGFSGLNLEQGWLVGDRLLRGLGAMIDEVYRKSRGFDRAGRIGGQRFLLFLGDTGPRAATSSTERLRQTLAASTFENQGQELHATCTCGVVEVGPRESTDDVMRRLSETIAAARKHGPGRTALDEGRGPAIVEAPTFDVPSQVLQLRDG